MGKYVLKRLVYIVIVFFVISFLMYALYNLIPTDPARAQLNRCVSNLNLKSTSVCTSNYERKWDLTTIW